MKIISFSGRVLKELYRDPIVIILAIGQPILFLLLFHYVGQSDPNAPAVFIIDNLVPGVIVFSFGFLTLFSAILLARDRKSAFLTRLLASPLTPVEFIFAYILPFIPIALLQIIVCLWVGVFLGMTFQMGIFFSFLVFLPIAIFCIAFGMILGSLFTETSAPPAGSIAIVVISLFGGVFSDPKMIGGVFGQIGYSLPFAHAVDAARALFQGSAIAAVRSELSWVLAYMFLCFLLGVIAFRWKTSP